MLSKSMCILFFSLVQASFQSPTLDPFESLTKSTNPLPLKVHFLKNVICLYLWKNILLWRIMPMKLAWPKKIDSHMFPNKILRKSQLLEILRGLTSGPIMFFKSGLSFFVRKTLTVEKTSGAKIVIGSAPCLANL